MEKKHHNLLAWRRAIDLVKLVYSVAAGFPASELYGLTGQMRRAAVSVPANIAEGVGRSVIVRELGYLKNTEDIDAAIDSVAALLAGLINAERRKSSNT